MGKSVCNMYTKGNIQYFKAIKSCTQTFSHFLKILIKKKISTQKHKFEEHKAVNRLIGLLVGEPLV